MQHENTKLYKKLYQNDIAFLLNKMYIKKPVLLLMIWFSVTPPKEHVLL